MRNAFSHFALCCAALTLFVGCGSAQPAVNAPSATFQNSMRKIPVNDGAKASGYATIYVFEGSPNAGAPVGGLIRVGGLFYGTAQLGGAGGPPCNVCGALYSVTSAGQEKPLFNGFTRQNGAYPTAALTFLNGSLYGVAQQGGKRNPYKDGHGVVFRVSLSGDESVVYVFKGGRDGQNPYGSLLALNGKLYGTTTGGSVSGGTLFELDTSGSERVLHRFKGAPSDGSYPGSNLVTLNGSIYGVTGNGGANNKGTVFEFSKAGKLNILHSFDSSKGAFPVGLVALKGTLYGTTTAGGGRNFGVVYSLSSAGEFHVLYGFRGHLKRDGALPRSPPIAVNGMLYGTTSNGGAQDLGTVYKLSLSGTESILHQFGHPPDGALPFAPLYFSKDVLYGTTVDGGQENSSGLGTIFKISP